MYSLNIATIAKQIQELIKGHSSNKAAITAIQTFDSDPVDTGMTWIDGNPIYRAVLSGKTPDSETSSITLDLDFTFIVSIVGTYFSSATGQSDFNRSISWDSATANKIRIYKPSSAGAQDKDFYIVVYYVNAPAGLLSPAPDDTRSIEPDEKLNIEETPEEEPQEVKKTTRKKS